MGYKQKNISRPEWLILENRFKKMSDMDQDKKTASEKEKKKKRKKEKTKKRKNEKTKKRERELDEQIEQSFPASDPPSYSKPGNEGNDDKDEEDK